MKELTIEDKAKLYDEAIKRAKAMIPVAANQEEICNSVITIFPELKESEDERIRKGLIELLRNLFNNYSYFIKDPFYTESIAWLEKQGDASRTYELGFTEGQRIERKRWLEKQGEQKPAWSEEDDRMMNDTLAVVDWYAGKHRNISVKVSNWLKLLKNRVLSSSLREFDKEEWSIIDHLIAICDDAMCYDTFAGCSKKDIEKYKTFLTNLKFGINPQPQTTWKPSDEHINWLIWVINRLPDTEKANEAEAVLRDLLEQLNKLREE